MAGVICIILCACTGKIQLKDLMMISKNAKNKWFELGVALDVDYDVLAELEEEYNECPIKALTRVYEYWLADENDLHPTWEKLIAALEEINEYTIAANAERKKMVGY